MAKYVEKKRECDAIFFDGSNFEDVIVFANSNKLQISILGETKYPCINGSVIRAGTWVYMDGGYFSMMDNATFSRLWGIAP